MKKVARGPTLCKTVSGLLLFAARMDGEVAAALYIGVLQYVYEVTYYLPTPQKMRSVQNSS